MPEENPNKGARSWQIGKGMILFLQFSYNNYVHKLADSGFRLLVSRWREVYSFLGV